jgi:hypothetical protein
MTMVKHIQALVGEVAAAYRSWFREKNPAFTSGIFS